MGRTVSATRPVRSGPGRRRLRRHGRQAARAAPPARAGVRRARDDGADPRPHGVARRSPRRCGPPRPAASSPSRGAGRGAAWSCGATSTACRCTRTRHAPSTPRSRASCTPAATTSTWPRCSARPRCWRHGARTCRAATSSSSSRPRRRCAGPRRCSSAARSTAMEGARLVGFHVTSQVPSGFVALRAGHRHVRGALAAHHADAGRAGTAPCPSAQGDVIRATAELVSRLGEVAAGLRYEETDCVCSAGTIHAGTAVNVVPDLGPRSPARCAPSPRPSTSEALVRLQDLCDQHRRRARASTSTSSCPSTRRAVVNDAEATDLVEAEASVVLGPDQVFRMPPVVAERRRERVPATTCPAATSSSAAARRTARAGCTTAPPSSSRTSRCASGPASSCAAPWHWPRREARGPQWADDAPSTSSTSRARPPSSPAAAAASAR